MKKTLYRKSFYLLLLTCFLIGISSDLFNEGTDWNGLQARKIWFDRELPLLGYDTDVISLGGVSGGLEINSDYILENPALAATEFRNTILLNGGYFATGGFHAGISYIHPTYYGIFGGAYQQTYNDKSGDFFFTMSTYFSKEINNFFLVGFKINFDYYQDNKEAPSSDDLQGIGFNLDGALTMRPDYTYFQDALVVENLYFTVAFRNLGLLPYRKGGLLIPEEDVTEIGFKMSEIIRTGVGLDFIKVSFSDEASSGHWKMRAMTDLALLYPINFAANLGLANVFTFNSTIDKFSFLTGYHYNPLLQDVLFPITTGFNLYFSAGEAKVVVKYGIVFSQEVNGFDDLNHSFTFDIYFGDYDEDPPEIDIEPYGEEGIIDEGVIDEEFTDDTFLAQ